MTTTTNIRTGSRTGARMLMAGGLVAGLMVLAGCQVNVNKDADGKDKDVSIHTPFGGMEVHDKGVASNTGVAAYPGAVQDSGADGNDKSVDMHMGFGAWQLRVQVASYVSQDPEAKIEAYYRKQLAQYGKVITCRDHEPVGTPTDTGEGLNCQEKTNVQGTHGTTGGDGLQLKAGSEKHQHIVAFDEKKSPGTHFSLIALTLPSDHDSGKGSEE
jgi:hypothetical protein